MVRSETKISRKVIVSLKVMSDMDIAESFQDIGSFIQCGAVAIKSCQPFFDDHIAGNGLQLGQGINSEVP